MAGAGAQLQPFLGIRFRLIGFDPEQEAKVRSLLIKGGGVDAITSGEDYSHVIVGDLEYDNPVCVDARNSGKTLVTSIWVYHSVEIGVAVDCNSIIYRPVRDLNGIPGSKNLILCLTGYQRQDREDIMAMTRLMGAQFSKPLVANKVTHLVCYKFEGEKYELAKKLKRIKLVNHRWLEDCLKNWELLPEERYSASGYELEIAETEAQDSDVEAEPKVDHQSVQILLKEEQKAPEVATDCKPSNQIETKDQLKSPWRSPKPSKITSVAGKQQVPFKIPSPVTSLESCKDLSFANSRKKVSAHRPLGSVYSEKKDDIAADVDVRTDEKNSDGDVEISAKLQSSLKRENDLLTEDEGCEIRKPNAKKNRRSIHEEDSVFEIKDNNVLSTNADSNAKEAALSNKTDSNAKETKALTKEDEFVLSTRKGSKAKKTKASKRKEVTGASEDTSKAKGKEEEGASSTRNGSDANESKASTHKEEAPLFSKAGSKAKKTKASTKGKEKEAASSTINVSDAMEIRTSTKEDECVLSTINGSNAKETRISTKGKQEEANESKASTHKEEAPLSSKAGSKAKKTKASTKEDEAALSAIEHSNAKKTRSSTKEKEGGLSRREHSKAKTKGEEAECSNAKETIALPQKEEAASSTINCSKAKKTRASSIQKLEEDAENVLSSNSNKEKGTAVLTAKRGKKTRASSPKEKENLSPAKRTRNEEQTLKKCFLLSGNREERKHFHQIIKRLKGRCCRDTHKWCYEATHFIAPEPLRRTEKFFAAAASGCWILKPSYVWACSEAGRLLDEEPYEWHGSGLTDDSAISLAAPRSWRLRHGGAFLGMRIAVYGECVAPSLETLKRVVRSGGGTVVATCPPYTRFVKLGIEYAVVSLGISRDDTWVREFLANGIPCVLPDYLVDFVCKPGFPLDKHVLFDSLPSVT